MVVLLLRSFQSLYASIIARFYDSSSLRSLLDFLWPRFKTQRLVKDLRSKGLLDEQKYKNLSKIRYFRRLYINAFVIAPFGFYITVFLFSFWNQPTGIQHITALFISISIIYLTLWSDYEDEWRYVNPATNGERVKGKVIFCRRKPIGNAVYVQVLYEKDRGVPTTGNMILWHGMAPNFKVQPNQEVEVAYAPERPATCVIITEETKALSLKREIHRV